MKFSLFERAEKLTGFLMAIDTTSGVIAIMAQQPADDPAKASEMLKLLFASATTIEYK